MIKNWGVKWGETHHFLETPHIAILHLASTPIGWMVSPLVGWFPHWLDGFPSYFDIGIGSREV